MDDLARNKKVGMKEVTKHTRSSVKIKRKESVYIESGTCFIICLFIIRLKEKEAEAPINFKSMPSFVLMLL